MKEKVLSLTALALFMTFSLNAKEENVVSKVAIDEGHECDVYAQNVFDSFISSGANRGAAYTISEIAHEECLHGRCDY